MAGDRMTRHELIDRLVEVRIQRGLSHQQVADRLCVTRSAVARFEKQYGSSTINTILRYAHAIGAEVTFTVRSVDQ